MPVKSKKLTCLGKSDEDLNRNVVCWRKNCFVIMIIYLIFIVCSFFLLLFNRKRFIRQFSERRLNKNEWKRWMKDWNNNLLKRCDAYGAISCFLNANWILRINSDKNVRINLKLKWIYFCLVTYETYKYHGIYFIQAHTILINGMVLSSKEGLKIFKIHYVSRKMHNNY